MKVKPIELSMAHNLVLHDPGIEVGEKEDIAELESLTNELIEALELLRNRKSTANLVARVIADKALSKVQEYNEVNNG